MCHHAVAQSNLDSKFDDNDLAKDCIAAGKNGELRPSKYNLIANVVHDGQPDQGSYRVHMHRKIEDQWYEVENLRVVDILPQVVALSETYMQVYELKNEK